MSYDLDIENRINILGQDNFEDLKTILLKINSKFDTKIDEVNDRITELELKIPSNNE